MMTKLKQWFARRAKAFNSTTIIQSDSVVPGVPLSRFATDEDFLQAACGKSWATWKACDIKAKAVVATPSKLVREKSNTEIQVPELERMFKYPNENETWRDLLYSTMLHVYITGRGFWLKDEANLTGDRPRRLIGLNPKRVKIVPDSERGIRGYIYTMNGKEMAFDREEIIYFKRPHPNHTLLGLGEIEAGRSLIAEHVNRGAMSESYFAKGAVPSGILINKNYTGFDTDFDRIKKKWSADYGGVKNYGKTAFIAGDWSYQQLGLTFAEMQQMEAAKINVEQIFILHGVPLSVAGVQGAANFATADSDNQKFKEYTILPDVQMLQDTINTDLVAGFNPQAKLVFNVTGLVNIGKVATDYAPLFDRGIVTPNEIRAALGLPTDEDRAEWNAAYISAGLVPMDLAGIADLGTIDGQAQRTVQQFVQNVLAPEERNGHERLLQ